MSETLRPGATVPTTFTTPGDDRSGGVVAVHSESGEEPGKPAGSNAPRLSSLQNKLCPNCSVGVLYVTRYDVDALHEKGQHVAPVGSLPALPSGYESGGAYEVRCFNCEWSASYALNPGQHHGEIR